MNDGWRKVTLYVPNGKQNGGANIGETPVAPPRRKRSTIIDRQPCGFKELFGNNVSRRSSCDSILKDDNPLSEREQEMLQQKRKSKSISDFNLSEPIATDSLSISTIRIPVTRTLSLMERAMVQQTTIPVTRPTLQRKVSRVGNKKSDKFFGENLSDCLSDEPITPSPEPTSISFTYHTISTLITPISHASNVNDKLDDFVNSNVNASKENGAKTPDETDANQILSPVPKSIQIEQIESRLIDPESKKSSLNKKAEFLMAMLEGNQAYSSSEESKIVTPPRRSHLKKRNSQTFGSEKTSGQDEDAVEKKAISTNNNEVKEKPANYSNDDDFYKGMTPVDEPIIIPRTRPIRHICDDDHHIHKHVEHNHASISENKENQPQQQQTMSDADIEKYIIMQVTNPPEKPKRDASVYEKSKQLNNIENSAPIAVQHAEIESIIPKQLPRVRHLSQENLMSKKILTKKSNDTIDLLRIKSMQKANNNNNNFDKFIAEDGLETILKKYTSQQSFFTQELLSQIADRVYGFQGPFEMLDTCDDGSLKCTPSSKLTTRKVSVHRKESTVTRPFLENVLEYSAVESAPKIVQMEAKQTNAIENVNVNDDKQIAKEKSNVKEIMNSGEIPKMPEHKENEAQDKQPTFINEQTKRDTEHFISMERANSIVCDKTDAQKNGNVQKDDFIESIHLQTESNDIKHELASDKNAENHVLDDIYKKNTINLDEFQNNFNGNILTVPSKVCDRLENVNSSDDDNSDSDVTVKEVSVVEQTKIYVGEPLKECHNGTEKRANDQTNTAYDTRKMFPFGKSDSGADNEFFESKLMPNSAEDILNGNIAKIELTAQHNGNANDIPTTNDHSILLKYLK